MLIAGVSAAAERTMSARALGTANNPFSTGSRTTSAIPTIEGAITKTSQGLIIRVAHLEDRWGVEEAGVTTEVSGRSVTVKS